MKSERKVKSLTFESFHLFVSRSWVAGRGGREDGWTGRRMDGWTGGRARGLLSNQPEGISGLPSPVVEDGGRKTIRGVVKRRGGAVVRMSAWSPAPPW